MLLTACYRAYAKLPGVNPKEAMSIMSMNTLAKTTPLWILVKIAYKVYGSMAVGLTNMGNISIDGLALDGNRPVEGVFAGPMKKKDGMQISAAGFDGAVSLCCIGEYGDETEWLV